LAALHRSVRPFSLRHFSFKALGGQIPSLNSDPVRAVERFPRFGPGARNYNFLTYVLKIQLLDFRGNSVVFGDEDFHVAGDLRRDSSAP